MSASAAGVGWSSGARRARPGARRGGHRWGGRRGGRRLPHLHCRFIRFCDATIKRHDAACHAAAHAHAVHLLLLRLHHELLLRWPRPALFRHPPHAVTVGGGRATRLPPCDAHPGRPLNDCEGPLALGIRYCKLEVVDDAFLPPPMLSRLVHNKAAPHQRGTKGSANTAAGRGVVGRVGGLSCEEEKGGGGGRRAESGCCQAYFSMATRMTSTVSASAKACMSVR